MAGYKTIEQLNSMSRKNRRAYLENALREKMEQEQLRRERDAFRYRTETARANREFEMWQSKLGALENDYRDTSSSWQRMTTDELGAYQAKTRQDAEDANRFGDMYMRYANRYRDTIGEDRYSSYLNDYRSGRRKTAEITAAADKMTPALLTQQEEQESGFRAWSDRLKSYWDELHADEKDADYISAAAVPAAAQERQRYGDFRDEYSARPRHYGTGSAKLDISRKGTPDDEPAAQNSSSAEAQKRSWEQYAANTAAERRRVQQELDAAKREESLAAEAYRRESAVAGPIGPEKQAKIEAARQSADAASARVEKLQAMLDDIPEVDPTFRNWSGRDELQKEYGQLQSLITSLEAPAASYLADYEEQHARLDSYKARLDEVRAQLEEGDRRFGNGPAEYSLRDRAGTVLSSAAKSIAGSGVNALATTADFDEKMRARTITPAQANQIAFGGVDAQELLDRQWEQYASQETRDSFEKLYAVADGISDAAAQELERAKNGLNKYGKAGVDIAANLLEMGFDAAVGKLTGGGSLASMFVRVYGDEARQARLDGATLEQQVFYGAAKGAIEVVTEKIADGVAGIYGKGAADDITETLIRRLSDSELGQSVLRAMIGAANEGGEEVLSDLFAPLAEKIYKDESLGELIMEMGPGEVLYDFLIGAAVGGLGSVGGVANGQYAQANAENAYLSAMYERMGETPSVRRETRDRAAKAWEVKEDESGESKAPEAPNYAAEAGEAMQAPRGQETESQRAQRIQETAEGMRAEADRKTGELVSAVFSSSGITLSDKAQEGIAQGYREGSAGIKDYTIGAREAYRMGENGAAMEETVQAVTEKYGLTGKQARTAWGYGASAQTGSTGTADVSTEEGRAKLESALSGLGSRMEEAAALYQGTQDVDRYAAAMSKAAYLYAANGADVGRIVQDARDGKSADLVGMLTDEQAKLAQEIGQEQRQKTEEAVKAAAESRKALREQAAALAGAKEGKTVSAEMLGSVEAQIEEARRHGQEAQSALKAQITALEAMEKADPQAKNSEAYQSTLAEANRNADAVQAMQTEIQTLERQRAQLLETKPVQRKKGTVSYQGGTFNGVEYKGVDPAKLTRQQKKVTAMVETLADTVNLDYVFVDAEAGFGGAYQFGGRIFVNINSGVDMKGGFSQTMAAASLSHELTHFVQDFAPEEYQALKDFVVGEVLKKSPQELSALVEQQRQWEKGRTLSYDEALDEVVANACETMLLDSKAINKLARQNMTLAEKIADYIEDWTTKVREAFEEVDTGTGAIYQAYRDVMDRLDEMQELWDNGLLAASENYDAGQRAQEGTSTDGGQIVDTTTEEQAAGKPGSSRVDRASLSGVGPYGAEENAATEGGGKYQAIRVNPGPSAKNADKRTAAYILTEHINDISDMSPVASLTGQEMNDRTKDIPTQIEEFFESVGGKVDREGFGTVILGEYGVGGIMNHKPINRAKMVTLVSVPDVIKSGRIINYDPNWKGRGYPSITIAAPVNLAGKPVYVAAVIDQRAGYKFYLNECVDSEGNYVRITEDPSDNTKSGITAQDGVTRGSEESSGNNITDSEPKSNGKLQRKDIEAALPQSSSNERERSHGAPTASASSIADAIAKSNGKYQAWDDLTDDTAAEKDGREVAYARIEAENAALSETVAALKKLAGKQEKTIGRLQQRLQLTKTPEVRESDARSFARQLVKDNSSTADVAEISEQLMELGNYILQTDAEKLDQTEVKDRARRIAAEIVTNASEQVGLEDETLTRIRDSIQGKKLTIDPSFFGELDQAGGFDSFRKRNFGRFVLASATSTGIDSGEYTSVSRFYTDLQGEYGKSYFPDLANEGEEIMAIAEYARAADPMKVNPFTQYMGEATEELGNRIAMEALGGVLRPRPATDADKAKSRCEALNAKIKGLRAENKLSQQEAGRLWQTVYDLSLQLDRAESKYRTLQISAEQRNAQLRAEGKARQTEIKALEREKAAGQIKELKEHYKDMRKNARRRRENTGTRRKIRKLVAELNNRLKHPSEKKHIPRELMQATLDVLNMIDLDTGLGGTAAAQKLADIRAMYESYQKSDTYKIAYDETVADMLDQLALTVRGTRVQDMNETQLKAVYDTLRSLTHVIDTAVSIKIGSEERDAFEMAKSMTRETRDIPKVQRGYFKEHWLPAGLRADVMFKRLGGFKKNSTWEQAARLLNDGQLKQTRLKMELSRPFAELFNNQKALADFTGVNWRGKIDQGKLADIGLRDADGNAILVTHDIMVSIYMDLLNEQNRKHFIRGGKTVPNLQEFYDGKGGWGAGSRRSTGIAERLGDLERQHSEAKAAQYGEWAAELEKQIKTLKSEGEQYADEVQASIERQLTDYDREWVRAAQQLMDTDSKRELNATTMEVYGIEKASVDNYWPITSDPDFLSKPMETVTSDMSLENAGFMKERIGGANPTLALGTVQTVTRQIDRVAQYCGIMPAVRSFGKIWSKTEGGYTDSLKKSVHEVFQKSGVDYVENLIADLQGARRQEHDTLGLDAAVGKLRGNLARATLTLNARVALAQAASYPTAAAELDAKSLAKAFFGGGKSGRIVSRADQELIAKWSPLLEYRMLGYASPTLGDIRDSNDPRSRLWRKARWLTGWIQYVDGATVGRLWYASEYWVLDHRPELQKGSDAYYEAVAAKFNDVVEKTQPNYTTMQRAEILRSPNSLVKTFTMFMTQRLQNFNILYDATASYQKARADYANGRNGVTQEDVREARQDMTRAVCSQIAQASTFVAFKVFADALLHNMKRYRDDDSGEITAESVGAALLDAYLDATMGGFIFGSELYGIMKGAVGVSKWYGLSVSGVDSINDAIDSFVKLASGGYDWSDEKGREKLLKNAENLALKVSTVFGVPADNVVKFVNMFKYHFQDAMNGEFLSFNAGFEPTKKQQKVRDAVAAGVPQKLYTETIRKADTNKQGGVSQDELGLYLTGEIKAGRMTDDQAKAIWNVQGWSKDMDAWRAAADKKAEKTAKIEAAGFDEDSYKNMLSDADTDGNGSTSQDELGAYLDKEIRARRMTEAKADRIWNLQGWKKTRSEWKGKNAAGKVERSMTPEEHSGTLSMDFLDPQVSGQHFLDNGKARPHERKKVVGEGSVKAEKGDGVYTDKFLLRKHALDYYANQSDMLALDIVSDEEWAEYLKNNEDINFTSVYDDPRFNPDDVAQYQKAEKEWEDLVRAYQAGFLPLEEYLEKLEAVTDQIEAFEEKYAEIFREDQEQPLERLFLVNSKGKKIAR